MAITDPGLRFVFMDAGQGDATLVVYPDNSLMLVDCGSLMTKQEVMGKIGADIERELNRRPAGPQQRTIATLVITHPDGDHYNLIRQLTLGNLSPSGQPIDFGTIIFGGHPSKYTSDGVGAWLNQNQAKWATSICNSAQPYADFPWQPNPALSRSGVEGWILSMNLKDVMKSKKCANEASVVLLLKYKDTHVYLMGDATKEVDDEIVGGYNLLAQQTNQDSLLEPPRTRRVALKVGHHGSDTASSDALIRQIQPQAIFISADARKGYWLPRMETINNISGLSQLSTNSLHTYVQYNDILGDFEEVQDTRMIYSTLFKYDSNNYSNNLGAAYHYLIKQIDGSIELAYTGT